MILLFLVLIGAVCFIASTNPIEYLKEMRLYKRDVPEKYKKRMECTFLERYWNYYVLKKNHTIQTPSEWPPRVIFIFTYLIIYCLLTTLSENVHIRVISDDENDRYIFGAVLFYVSAVICYPVAQYTLAKIGYNEPFPKNRHWKAAASFLILYLLCALSFPGILKMGINYGVAEWIAAAPLMVSGFIYAVVHIK